MGQRVRRLSSPGGEDTGEGEGQEQRGGEAGGGEKRGERRRQAQLLQIHKELQNVEVILLLCVSPLSSHLHVRLQSLPPLSTGFVQQVDWSDPPRSPFLPCLYKLLVRSVIPSLCLSGPRKSGNF